MRSRTTASAAAEWIKRLDAAPEAEVPAANLYAGEHWSVATRIATRQSPLNVFVWVASAGYGLVPFTAPLKPYSASFNRSDADGVPTTTDRWWHEIAAWSGPVPGLPRTLAELAGAHPGAALILVLSTTYLAACVRDATSAAIALQDRGQFAVISCGTRQGPLLEHILPADARLQTVVGGSRQSLNARVAEHVLDGSTDGFSVRQVRERLGGLLERQPAIRVYDRKRLSDDEFRRLIRDQLCDRTLACTPLLSELRAAGYACEQSRFRGLYAQVCRS